MNDERGKEIEHVNPLSKYSGGFFKQRDKARQQIIDRQQQNAKHKHFNLLAPKKNRKAKGEIEVVNGKEKEAKEKKWNWKS